jgi:PIN domain nuclease of toxin-antitoxin system
MRLLLDTNAFLWASTEPRRLSLAARKAISNPANERILSHISIWEIVTKAAAGKLNERWTPEEIERQCSLLDIDALLPIELKHIYHLRTLPPVHHDPFDRLLVAQAQIEGLRMVSADSMISDHYLPNVIW